MLNETQEINPQETMAGWQAEEKQLAEKGREGVRKMMAEVAKENQDYLATERKSSESTPTIETAGFGQTPLRMNGKELEEMRRIRDLLKSQNK